MTQRQTTVVCRETGASSAAELRAEGETETKAVFPVPRFWQCTVCLLIPPRNCRGPGLKRTSSLLHRISLQSQAQPYPQVRQGKPPRYPPECPPECPEVAPPGMRGPHCPSWRQGQPLPHFISFPSRKYQLRGSLYTLARIKGQNPQTSYGHRGSTSGQGPGPLRVPLTSALPIPKKVF